MTNGGRTAIIINSPWGAATPRRLGNAGWRVPPSRLDLIKEVTADVRSQGGYFFFMMVTKRPMMPTIARVYVNRPSYVTIIIPPFTRGARSASLSRGTLAGIPAVP